MTKMESYFPHVEKFFPRIRCFFQNIGDLVREIAPMLMLARRLPTERR